jgi:hypothetical protein
MGKYQRLPYNAILRKGGRPKDTWRRSITKEAGRSWNELRFMAADRQKWKELTHKNAPNRKIGLYYFIIIIILHMIVSHTSSKTVIPVLHAAMSTIYCNMHVRQ